MGEIRTILSPYVGDRICHPGSCKRLSTPRHERVGKGRKIDRRTLLLSLERKQEHISATNIFAEAPSDKRL